MKSNADEQELLEKVRFSFKDERATEMLSLRLEPGYIRHLDEFVNQTGVKRSDAVRAAILALSEVAVLRVLDKDREARVKYVSEWTPHWRRVRDELPPSQVSVLFYDDFLRAQYVGQLDYDPDSDYTFEEAISTLRIPYVMEETYHNTSTPDLWTELPERPFMLCRS